MITGKFRSSFWASVRLETCKSFTPSLRSTRVASAFSDRPTSAVIATAVRSFTVWISASTSSRWCLANPASMFFRSCSDSSWISFNTVTSPLAKVSKRLCNSCVSSYCCLVTSAVMSTDFPFPRIVNAMLVARDPSAIVAATEAGSAALDGAGAPSSTMTGHSVLLTGGGL